jgi:hypothetical protein
MRVLFTHHFPLNDSAAGRLVQQWTAALTLSGSEVRTLLVDEHRQPSQRPAIERVVCRAGDSAADLAFDVPGFTTSGLSQRVSGQTFLALSNVELAQYRDRLRRKLDAMILEFDPHILHVQHVWVLGQLALETGVPYVLNAWGPELVDAAADPRFRELAEQAAENASRILAVDHATLEQLTGLYDVSEERAQVLPAELALLDSPLRDEQTAMAEHLRELYQAVLQERFG